MDFAPVEAIPISAEGLTQTVALAKHISAPPDFMETGITEYSGYNLIFLPTKIAPNPVLTVGLSETISAIAFLSE